MTNTPERIWAGNWLADVGETLVWDIGEWRDEPWQTVNTVEYVRADLEATASPSIATPLDDPLVLALVDALQGTTTALDEITSDDWLGDIDDKKVRKTLHQARAALSALEENK